MWRHYFRNCFLEGNRCALPLWLENFERCNYTESAAFSEGDHAVICLIPGASLNDKHRKISKLLIQHMVCIDTAWTPTSFEPQEPAHEQAYGDHGQ